MVSLLREVFFEVESKLLARSSPRLEREGLDGMLTRLLPAARCELRLELEWGVGIGFSFDVFISEAVENKGGLFESVDCSWIYGALRSISSNSVSVGSAAMVIPVTQKVVNAVKVCKRFFIDIISPKQISL